MSKMTLTKLVIVAVMLLLPGVKSNAQDWNSIFSGVADAVGDKLGDKLGDKISKKKDTFDVTGTWVYAKPDCKFDSDDLLSKAGGELAAAKIEKTMSDLMNRLGMSESSVFTFNADSSYTITRGDRIMKGTYSLNKETKEIVMTSRLKMNFTAKVVKNVLAPNKMSFLFKADKLMSFAQGISGALAKRSSNKTLASINKLFDQYDGMMLGFELKNDKATGGNLISEK